MIITSTSEVYGTADYTPIDENHPLKPQSPYSASKIAADNIALSYYNSFKTPLQFSDRLILLDQDSPRAIIPTIINQILKNLKITK